MSNETLVYRYDISCLINFILSQYRTYYYYYVHFELVHVSHRWSKKGFYDNQGWIWGTLYKSFFKYKSISIGYFDMTIWLDSIEEMDEGLLVCPIWNGGPLTVSSISLDPLYILSQSWHIIVPTCDKTNQRLLSGKRSRCEYWDLNVRSVTILSLASLLELLLNSMVLFDLKRRRFLVNTSNFRDDTTAIVPLAQTNSKLGRQFGSRTFELHY